MSAKVLKRRPSLKDYEIFKDGTTEVEYTKQVLDRKIDWKQLADSKLINANDAGLLLDYDKQSEDDQANLLGERGPEYAKVFIKVLADVSTPETAQYVLAMVDKLLSANNQRALDFHRAKNEGVDIYAPLLRFLNRASENPFTISKAAKITAILLSHGEVASSPAVSEFLHYLTSKLGSAKAGELVSVLGALKTMMRSQPVQVVFVREGGLKSLTSLLRKETQNTQMLYQVVFCFWLMSFNADLLKDLHDSDAIVRVAEVLKNVLREKVVRVAFAMLRNLLNKPGFNETMIASGLMKLLPTLTSRKWQDDEITDDVNVVGDTLERFVITLSSYEKYSAEVLSGNLEWSPVHNEKFWRENISKFEEDNFNLIKCLVALLETDDELVLEVACYDLGEFARFHPDGKKILAQLGGKTKLMTRMSHKSPRVVKQALLAVQKLMVHNWESLSGGSNTGAAVAPGS